MKKYKTPIIVGVIIIVALVAAFFAGGDNSWQSEYAKYFAERRKSG